MRLGEHLSLESIAGAVRRPLATLAAVATLAAGVALETPAVAWADQSQGNAGAAAPAEASAAHTEHDSGDGAGPVIALAVLAGAVVAGGAILTAADRTPRR